jgi:hypothetical protein
VLNGKAIVIGGENNNQVFNAVEEFDPSNANEPWRTLSPMPTPRHGAAGGVIRGMIHVVGGSSAPGVAATVAHEVFSLNNQPPAELNFRLFLPLITRR